MGGFSSIFAITSLIGDLFWGAFYGIIVAVITIKFYDKFPFKTLFMKIFGLALIIDAVVTLLFGGFLLLFAGPLTLLITVITFIVSDFVYAKIVANKLGPLTNLP